MAGTIDGGGYGYLHITGSLTGTIDAHSYTTIVIDGDLAGTLKVRSYVTLVVARAPARQDRPVRLVLEHALSAGFWSRQVVEAIEGDFHQFTLHVQSSEMPVGKVEGKVGPWREVIVADPVWKKLAR